VESWIVEIMDRITLEDLPESYRDVAGAVGIESAIRLSDAIGGVNYYFPKAERMLREKRNEIIRAEFDGANHRALVKKYRLSETQIREIVDRPKTKGSGGVKNEKF
jgi:Mor family transcriptional regulator